MSGLIGKSIDRNELKARWAYAELASSRFGNSFKKADPDPLFQKAVSSVHFETLSHPEKSDLIVRLDSHHDRKGLAPALNRFATFRCVEWTRSELLRAFCVPGLNWTSLSQYPTLPPSFNQLLTSIEPTDRFAQGEPIIVIPFNDGVHIGDLLLEGTRRSVLFLRLPATDPTKIFVWYPETE